ISNAGFEGIVCAGPGKFILAAERHPRGIVEVELQKNGKPPLVHAQLMPHTECPMPFWRFPDFSDFFLERGTLYAVVRNADCIVPLTSRPWHEDPGAHEENIWSFAKTVNAPEYSYRYAFFGTIEGLCMDRDRIYLVTDNNNCARTSDANDR